MFHWLVGHHWIYSDLRMYVELERALTTWLPDKKVYEYAMRTCKYCSRCEEKLGAHNYVENWVEIKYG